jgi:DNA polymerase (family 10)
MNLNDLIEALEEMAVLLELDGANGFKVRAYQNAVRALPEHDDVLDELVADNRLTDIQGVGQGLAEKIAEFAKTGRIGELDELRKRIPPGLVEMIRIPGFGPKKAIAVHKELGIDTVAKLKEGCEDGRVSGLKGFGAKTAEKILAGIEQLARFSGRHRLDQGMALAAPILEALRRHPAVERAETAGSLRRWRETVGDLDFVVSTMDPKAVMEFFVALPGVTAVLGQGETKSSVMIRGKIQADIRCVSDSEFPYTLMHFTGSKEHNTRMRSRAKDMGLKLNEYGLFPEGSDKSLPAVDEKAIHAHLGLDYVVPELREDTGEIDAAAAHALPKLITDKSLRGLLHMHTHYSDGKPTLDEYAAWAAEHGIQWMGIADHSRSLTVANGLPEERVLQQHAEIDRVNAQFAKRKVRLLKGIESDILLDGSLDYSEEFLKNFEFVVGSVHSHFNLTEKEQTARILRALDNPATTVLGHMTGRILLAREGYAVDQREVIRHAARVRVAIEINANPYRLDVDWRLIHFALEQGCKLTIGPDAHAMDGLGDAHYGIAMARKGWATADDVLNCLDVDAFLRVAASRR